MLTLQEEPSSLKKSYKFIRLSRISPELRMRLGVLMVCFSYHGQVTNLAAQYSVSRTFLYSLKAIVAEQLAGLFDADTPAAALRSLNRQIAWEQILQLRLIGKCSLWDISELLSLNHPMVPNSTCFISQFLKQLGTILGMTVDWKGSVWYASDEIFMVGHQPILVTIDPISMTILRMECLKVLDKAAWEKHWKALKEKGILAEGLVKDEGIAMNAAQQGLTMKGVPSQTDTFHAVSHRLGVFVSRLSTAVDKAILYEWERQRVLQNAVSEEVIAKRKLDYEQACEQTLVAINQLEDFQFLYACIYEQFNIFGRQGQARQRQTAIEETTLALELMKELAIPKLTEEVEKIEQLVGQLFDFLPKAQLVQYQLEQELGETQTFFWIYAWQTSKKSRKIKDYQRSKALAQKSQTALVLLQEHYQLKEEAFQALQRSIFKKFDSIVQSSALVETINSILRTYMNSAKNQLVQEQLNVIRFYLNHRVIKRGVRKAFAPIELLRGEKLKQSWCDLLLAKAA